MSERPYEPTISIAGRLVFGALIVIGMLAGFGWLLV